MGGRSKGEGSGDHFTSLLKSQRRQRKLQAHVTVNRQLKARNPEIILKLLCQQPVLFAEIGKPPGLPDIFYLIHIFLKRRH